MKEEKVLTLNQQRLAQDIFKIGAVEFGSREIKSHEENPEAPLSPIYLKLRIPDNKGGPLTDEMVEAIGKEIFDAVEKAGVKFDLVAGIPRAGEPFAKVVSRLSGKSLIFLGKKVEGDRRKIDSVISGDFRLGQVALLIDDLITKGHTKKEAIRACKEAGLRVAGVAVLVDREQGGSEELTRNGYNVYSAFTLMALLDYYISVGKIDQKMYASVVEYLAVNR